MNGLGSTGRELLIHVVVPSGRGAIVGDQIAESDQLADTIMYTIEMKLTAVFMKVPEGYGAFVEELPGASTQGDTLEEARENLNEALYAMVLEANREMAEESRLGTSVIRETFVLPVR